MTYSEKMARAMQGANALRMQRHEPWDEVSETEREHWLFLADAAALAQSARISELLRFNNEFEERARAAERELKEWRRLSGSESAASFSVRSLGAIERAAQIAEANGKPCIAMAIRGLK